jgi:hypothetical protein
VIHKPDGASEVVSNSLIPLHYSFYWFSGLASDYYCLNRNALAKRSDVRDVLALHALTFQAVSSIGKQSSAGHGTKASIQMVF